MSMYLYFLKNMSRFDELAKLNEVDHKETYDYVSSITFFISVVRQKIMEYLGCESSKVYFLGSDNKKGTQHGTATIGENGYFDYRILVKLSEDGFNTNECGDDFWNKKLVPPTGIILVIGVKACNNFFRVAAPSFSSRRVEFQLSMEIDTEWEKFLDSCFQALKHIASQKLSDRIEKIPMEQENQSRAFGFQLDN